MTIQSESIFSNELLYRILKMGIREGILDIPDLKSFRQCARDCAIIGKCDKIWLEVALRIDEDFKNILIKLKSADRDKPSIFEILRKYLSDYAYMKRVTFFLCSQDEKFYLPDTIEKIKLWREEQKQEQETFRRAMQIICNN